jgi:hypothetical protein
MSLQDLINRAASPLGIKEEEYLLLGPAAREFCWRRRFRLPDDEPIPSAVIQILHWDPAKMSLTERELEYGLKVAARFEKGEI